jgi:hypothetical protein
MPQALVHQLEAELAIINHQLSLLQARRDGILKVLDTYEGKGDTESSISAPDLSTIEMARQVLKDHGSPLGTADIRRAIQRKFATVAAPSLQQMLYMRARDGKIFYNEQKKYGLLSWKRSE